MAKKPSLGRIVHYNSKTLEGEKSAYTLAAIVTATEDTLWPPGVDQGHVRELNDDMHVHLTVFTCGDATMGGNDGGTYQEFDVPYSEDATPGSWTWPAIV